MKKLVYAVAMAGRGERFARAGHALPKYMVRAGGATLFEHSLRSLPPEPAAKIVFIALKEHEEKYGLRAFVAAALERVCGGAAFVPSYDVLLLGAPTRGQAETVLAAKGLVPPGSELGIFNIDTKFESPSLGPLLLGPGKRDGVLGSFLLEAQDPKWSFARTGPDGLVTEVAEKKQISPDALTGFYHFTSASDFFAVAEAALKAPPEQAGEYYVAPLYNRLIAEGRKFVLDRAASLTPLGTPEDVARFAAR